MRSTMGWRIGAVLVALLAMAWPARTARADFPLKDGDNWVMVGDSITAQHLHSNYFEAFCYARYPKLTFRFRNSGVGGDTIGTAMNRFAWDAAEWKPTVVSVELGMNDQGGTTPDQYIVNMTKLRDKIKAAGARPVFFSASPMNNGDSMAKLGGNTRLEQFATKLKAFAAEQQAPFADQFHELLDVWASQKAGEIRMGQLNLVKAMAKDDALPGVEHLRAFITVQEKNPLPMGVSMSGDAVHPGAPGQLCMAAALLKQLGADGFVSSATIAAKWGEPSDAKGCVIDTIATTENGQLSFNRLDECLPFPIPEDARAVLPVYPAILELSQYTLKVTGLPEGSYDLKIDGKPAGMFTAKELAAGINLTALPQGAIAAQMKEVLAAVNAKEGLVSAWRGVSKSLATAPTDAKQKLTEAAKKVDDADAKIREAAKPRKLHFEISPAKPAK